MSGNIRKQLGPVRKRLRDRIAEAKLVVDEGDFIRMKSIKAKLIANVETHVKVYERLFTVSGISDVEQKIVDIELETSAELELDGNEMLQEINERLNAECSATEDAKSLKDQTREGERIEREIEKLKIETDYKRAKLDKLNKPVDHSAVGNADFLANVKLPMLSLPSFSGDLLKWPSFWDSFSSMIHNNDKVSKVDKFKYLLSALEDDAKDVLTGFSITEAQYDPAVALLKSRFDDKEFIIHQHYASLSLVKPSSNSTRDLRKTFNSLETHIRSLVSLGENVDNNHLVSLVKTKFPREFNLKLEENRNEVWTLDLLRKMINKLIIAREKSEHTEQATSQDYKYEQYAGEGLLGKEMKANCAYCDGNHWPDECQRYKTLQERKMQLRGRCFICLSKKHFFRQCLSQKPCFYCQRKSSHHSSLCPNKFGEIKLTAVDFHRDHDDELVAFNERLTYQSNGNYDVLMKIAKIRIAHPITGEYRFVNALFDSEAKKTYIVKHVAEGLGLKSGPVNLVKLNTFGTNSASEMYTMKTQFSLKENEQSVKMINAKICDNITGKMFRQGFDVRKYKHIWKDLILANGVPDGKSYEMSLDVLIGNDYYDDIVKSEKLQLEPGLYLVNSTVGWMFSGRIEKGINDGEHVEMSMFCEEKVDRKDNELWDLGTIGIKPITEEMIEKRIEKSFIEKITKKDRYYVSWLWKESRYELPDNYHLSKARLKTLIQNLSYDDLLKYNEIIKKFELKGMIEKSENDKGYLQQKSVVVHYLPHNLVYNKEDPDGKRRVVFEGKAKSHSSKRSLNDCLYKGRNMVVELCGVLLRFRMHIIGIIADIEKAYLQLGLNEEDRDVVRFLWLKDITKPFSDENIQEHRFCRVIWGIVCAAYLLSATISFHLDNYNSEMSKIIKRDLYVDNLISGASSSEDAIKFYRETKKIFSNAEMNMCQWVTNEEVATKSIKTEDKCDMKIVKVLGTIWNLDEDKMGLFMWKGDETLVGETKRDVLKGMSQVYDPTGMCSPIMVKPKKLYQDLWKLKIGWDEEIPDDKKQEWKRYVKDFSSVHNLSYKRCIDPFPGKDLSSYEIIIFTDASIHTYAAVVYLKVTNGGSSCVNLIFSKTRLSPVNGALSIPRLELMGLVIGCRAGDYVLKQLQLRNVHQRIFTDSKCVLEWCRSDKELKRFVADRVKEIKSYGIRMGYVRSEDNPADLASRGTDVGFLKDCKLWWEGPDWIKKDVKDWPLSCYEITNETRLDIAREEKKKNVFEMGMVAAPIVSLASPLEINAERFSSFLRLIRVTAWCLRFVYAIRKKSLAASTLTAEELDSATLLWTKYVQKTNFQQMFGIDNGEKKNSLKGKLGVYVDVDGFLRCGGRFQLIKLHPLLLPKSKVSCYVELLIQDAHKRLMHAGESQTLAELRRQFLIIQGRSSVKKVLSKCLTCRKWEGGPFKAPNFAPLPEYSISTSNPPFTYIGLDYLGPLYVREDVDELSKNWVCLFTCLSIRAVHFEVVKDMSTSSFILCIRRFIARCGTPKMMISDNASQLKMGSVIIQDVWNNIIRSEEVQSYIANHRIVWKFTFEHAPWQGGFFERLVGITKRALRKAFGKNRFNFVELVTLIAETQAVVNSRPLCYVGDDVNSDQVITPAHFTVLNHKTGFPNLMDEEYHHEKDDVRDNLLAQWRKGQHHLKIFWNCWVMKYLPALRERSKEKMKNIKGEVSRTPILEEVVIVKEEGLPRGRWKLAKVKDLLKSGIDNVERAVRLLMPNGRYITRPFRLVYPLEISGNNLVELNNTILKPKESSKQDENEKREQRLAATIARKRIRDTV